MKTYPQRYTSIYKGFLYFYNINPIPETAKRVIPKIMLVSMPFLWNLMLFVIEKPNPIPTLATRRTTPAITVSMMFLDLKN